MRQRLQELLPAQHRLKRCEPALLVNATRILGIMPLGITDALDQLPLELAPPELTLLGKADRDGKGPSLPLAMKHHFTAHARQPAGARHLGDVRPYQGGRAHETRPFLTPIMPSRSIN